MAERNFNSPNPPADLPVDGGAPNQNQEPEDILASVDTDSPAIRTPDQPAGSPDPLLKSLGTSASSSVPPAVAPKAKSISKEPILGRGKRTLVLGGVVVIILVVLVGGAWYGYGVFVSSSGSQIAEPTPANNQPEVTPTQPKVTDITPEPVIKPPVDTDRDGLSDADEELYGTDPNAVDSDQDGLTDRDEIKVFKTDPNNFDTDGDGFGDGEEVRGGYDPKGPGKLLKIE